jgi:hypothetical protein
MECRPAVAVVVKRGTPRKWSSQTINGDFSKTVSMEVNPTHPLTHHVPCPAQWRIGRAVVSEFFQRVLEDDERKACSPPTPDRRKFGLFYYYYHTVIQYLHSTRLDPFHLGRKGERADGSALSVTRRILYRPREQEMARAFAHIRISDDFRAR